MPLHTLEVTSLSSRSLRSALGVPELILALALTMLIRRIVVLGGSAFVVGTQELSQRLETTPSVIR